MANGMGIVENSECQLRNLSHGHIHALAIFAVERMGKAKSQIFEKQELLNVT